MRCIKPITKPWGNYYDIAIRIKGEKEWEIQGEVDENLKRVKERARMLRYETFPDKPTEVRVVKCQVVATFL